MTRIELIRGDIASVAAEAIVTAANSGLVGGGGVDGAIHRAGGPAIMADLVRRYGPDRSCPPGSAVVSAAGDLPARIVVHAVGPIWRGGASRESELLSAAYATSLTRAADEGCRTVALPSISTGVYGYPVDAAARVAMDAVADWVRARPDAFDTITFVLFSAETLAAFERARDLVR